MKLVREYIDFERGREPKRAIGIGLSQKIARGLESFAKDPLIRRVLHIYSISSQDRGRYSTFPDETNFYMEIPAQDIPTKELMEEILDKHIGLEYFSDIWEDHQMWHVWRPMIKAEYDDNFLEAVRLRVNETMDFERGKDPRSVLGKYRIIKLVREYIEFERGNEPKDSLDIGMKQKVYNDLLELNRVPGVLGMQFRKGKDGEPRLLVKYVGEPWTPSSDKTGLQWENTVNKHIGEYVEYNVGNPDDQYYSFPIYTEYANIIESILDES